MTTSRISTETTCYVLVPSQKAPPKGGTVWRNAMPNDEQPSSTNNRLVFAGRLSSNQTASIVNAGGTPMDTRKLVQTAQQNGGFKSLRDMAKAMGLNNSSLSLLASGKGELSDETYIKLAKLAGIDPAEVLIEKHARKAGPEGRAIWERIAKTLPKTAALLAGVAIIIATNQYVEAKTLISCFAKCPLCKI